MKHEQVKYVAGVTKRTEVMPHRRPSFRGTVLVSALETDYSAGQAKPHQPFSNLVDQRLLEQPQHLGVRLLGSVHDRHVADVMAMSGWPSGSALLNMANACSCSCSASAYAPCA